MPETISATRSKALRPRGKSAELKWLAVLAAMLVATVIDGIAISDVSRSVADTVLVSDKVAVTLPSDRCEPGCAIMVAFDQGSPRLQ